MFRSLEFHACVCISWLSTSHTLWVHDVSYHITVRPTIVNHGSSLVEWNFSKKKTLTDQKSSHTVCIINVFAWKSSQNKISQEKSEIGKEFYQRTWVNEAKVFHKSTGFKPSVRSPAKFCLVYKDFFLAFFNAQPVADNRGFRHKWHKCIMQTRYKTFSSH